VASPLPGYGQDSERDGRPTDARRPNATNQPNQLTDLNTLFPQAPRQLYWFCLREHVFKGFSAP